jgi:site-specific recombinase XerD
LSFWGKLADILNAVKCGSVKFCICITDEPIQGDFQALHLFSRYIRDTGRSDAGFIIGRKQQNRAKPCWLTKSEIQRLYEATADNVLGIRDRAMLAVYYGCGLRLNEGINLHTGDILQDKKLLHVRKGKHYKERVVPIAEKNYEELKLYLN